MGQVESWWRSRGGRAVGGAALAATTFLSLVAVPSPASGQPVVYQAPEDHFKYGSLGGERGYRSQLGFGIPYWIWIALPELFPEYLPDRTPGRGYASFGYIYEPGRDPKFELPIGVSQRNVLGLDRVWLTCGACHTGTYRSSPEGPRVIVPGMPANRYDQGRWAKFLFSIALDEKFTGERILQTIDRLREERKAKYTPGQIRRARLPGDLSPIDRAAFKFIALRLLRERLLMLRDRLSFIDLDSWGPGRVDTFNAPKALLNFPMDRAEPGELIGNVDLPSVWYQRARAGMQLHWDGNNTSVGERNLSASFAATIPPTLDVCALERIADFLATAAPPAFAAAIDRGRAARGAVVYREYCAGCHGAAAPPFRQDGVGETVGTVVPIAAIGTDRWRLDSYTPMLSRAQNQLYAGYPRPNRRTCRGKSVPPDYPARFSHFRKTEGYANSPLDGLWLRAPYLHNGSVPTLRDLLEPGMKRPRGFWTGYDVYDFDRVGFITTGPAAAAEGWWYDTAAPGNGNQGHEGRAYGTELPPADKDALVEYLKTF